MPVEALDVTVEAPGVAAEAPGLPVVVVVVGFVEETEAGADVGAGLMSGVALMDAEAAVDVAAEAAPEAVEEASELGGQLNAGCDAGDCGRHVAVWLHGLPLFSSAKKTVSSVRSTTYPVSESECFRSFGTVMESHTFEFSSIWVPLFQASEKIELTTLCDRPWDEPVSTPLSECPE